jgi:hypothetical protein
MGSAQALRPSEVACSMRAARLERADVQLGPVLIDCTIDSRSRASRRPGVRQESLRDRPDLDAEGWQIAVLSRVLVLHPPLLNADELRREMLAAVGVLVAAGLLGCNDAGGRALPTPCPVESLATGLSKWGDHDFQRHIVGWL